MIDSSESSCPCPQLSLKHTAFNAQFVPLSLVESYFWILAADYCRHRNCPTMFTIFRCCHQLEKLEEFLNFRVKVKKYKQVTSSDGKQSFHILSHSRTQHAPSGNNRDALVGTVPVMVLAKR